MDSVITRLDGNLLWVILNRPGKLNALNRDIWTSLFKVLEENCERKDIKALTITGAGRAFSAGDDIYDMYSFKDITEARSFFGIVYSVIEKITYCRKPVFSLVNGLAYAGGAEILLITDYNVSVKDASFSFPEIHIGLIPPILVTVGTKLLGPHKAFQLAYTGQIIDSKAALNLGLIDELVDSIDEGKKKILEISSILPNHDASLIRQSTIGSSLGDIKSTLEKLAELTLTEKAKHLMGEMIRKWEMKKKFGMQH